MLKLHLINTRHNILREDLTTLVTDIEELKPYHAELLRLCKEKHGVGIAANQVGLRMNFFFLTAGAKIPTSGSVKSFTAHICANPTWTPAKDARTVAKHEGCLSLPGREFVVERYAAIDAEWTNMVGHRVQRRLANWAARVFQHEHDHLRGVTLLASGKEVK